MTALNSSCSLTFSDRQSLRRQTAASAWRPCLFPVKFVEGVLGDTLLLGEGGVERLERRPSLTSQRWRNGCPRLFGEA